MTAGMDELRRQLLWIVVALVFMGGGALGWLAAGVFNGLTEADLIPGRVQACNTSLKTSIIGSNLIASDVYSAEESQAMAALSGSCLDPVVYEQLDPTLLELLERSPINTP